MKTGIFITARLGSTRLKKKHLLEVNSRPILYFLIQRIENEFQSELADGKAEIIIVTSDEEENREFERFIRNKIGVFYGSVHNIPLRHLQAAKKYFSDLIIAIDGDDILCSTKGMRAVYEALLRGVPYAKTVNLPFGMNSNGYSMSFLESSLAGHMEDTLETGWGRIFDQNQLVDVPIPFTISDDLLRFTLDYAEDYQFFKAVINAFGEAIVTAQDEEIVRLVVEKKLYRITEPVAKKYWENFNRTKEKEIITKKHES